MNLLSTRCANPDCSHTVNPLLNILCAPCIDAVIHHDEFKIISSTPVLHRANVRGIVIVENRVIENSSGKRLAQKLWANWDNPEVILRTVTTEL